jgi:formamidopyrimidine-DNA glycosylase
MRTLFLAGIRPRLAAGRLSRVRCDALVDAVRDVLGRAIQVGGTTLRDFVGGNGVAGHFAVSLNVYGRAGEPCYQCSAPLKGVRSGQRATVYCANCQR